MNKIAAAHVSEAEIDGIVAEINTTRFSGVVAHREDNTLIIRQVINNRAKVEFGAVRLEGGAIHSWEAIANSLTH